MLEFNEEKIRNMEMQLADKNIEIRKLELEN